MQPVREMLAGNTQCGAVFHQADVMNVRYLRAANTLIDPAHDIPEDTLAIVVNLLPDVIGRPVRLRYRDGEDVGQLCPRHASPDLLLALEHVDLMIVQGVQGCGSG